MMPKSEYRSIDNHPSGSRRSVIPRTSGMTEKQQQEQQLLVQKINYSEILTEEEIQREKFREAAEIEAGVDDIKEATDEFATLLAHQQIGIDNITGNVKTALQNVNAGTEQISSASRRKKCCGRLLYGFLFILCIAVAIVLTVLFIVKG